MLQIEPVEGLGEILPGTDVAAAICGAFAVAAGDVVVVTSKVVSKAEGRFVDLADVDPGPFARGWSARWGKDARVTEIVLSESARIVRMAGPVLITETHHGFVCANAGVDQSSSGAVDRVVLLPLNPDESARRMRQRFAELGADVAVIVSDTFGRPWREGQTDVAIGVAGMAPIVSYIGTTDPHGHEFRVQELCIVDELAGAAELVKGNTARVPAAVIRGVTWTPDDGASMAPVLRDPAHDLFR